MPVFGHKHRSAAERTQWHDLCAVAGLRCSVVGVPKTIDGDLKNDAIAVSFGFDTACKVGINFLGHASFLAKV